jgi:hypothetical protein
MSGGECGRKLRDAFRMIQFFSNRAGENLAPKRKRELEEAKRLLQERARGRS